jgi:hypothetical protein
VTLGAGQYLLVWCDDKNRAVAGNPLHTNWKISSSGETITLTDAANTTVSSAPAAALPQNFYGRLPNGPALLFSFLLSHPVQPIRVRDSQRYCPRQRSHTIRDS